MMKTTNFKVKNRVLYLVLLLIALLIYLTRSSYTDVSPYFRLKTEKECIFQQELKQTHLSLEKHPQRAFKYLDLNKDEKHHILVLTTIFPQQKEKDIEAYLENYFDIIDQSNYPNKYITLGFLIVNNNNKKQTRLLNSFKQKVQKYQHDRWNKQFFQINVYQKSFSYNKKTHMEPIRARAKNFLLTASLKEFHEWVFWLDIGLHSFPKNIFKDMIAVNEDVVVPNCLLKRDNADEFWGYERSNWQESDTSLERQQYIDQNQIISEGYYEYSIGRNLLVDMPSHLGLEHRVPLDGVGGSFIMVKSTVHRQGVIFPPFVYQHQIDTEGFAKMAKSMGFTVYGIPGYTVYHH